MNEFSICIKGIILCQVGFQLTFENVVMRGAIKQSIAIQILTTVSTENSK